MNNKPSPSLADELKPFVAPFRFDGSGEFHLKSYPTAEKGGIDKDAAQALVDDPPVTAADALARGMVDALSYRDQVDERIDASLEEDKLRPREGHHAQEPDLELS